MGGRSGGSSSAPTEQTVYSTDLPEYVEPYFTRLLSRGEGESLQQYTPYGGQRLAYFSPDELTSQSMTRGFAMQGTPMQYQQAQNILGQMGGYGSTYQATPFTSSYDPSVRGSEYQAGQFTPQAQSMSFEQGIGRFMSPFQQAVTDIAKREATRGSEIQADKISDAAAMSGGLGGYREAILQAERERNLGQRLDDLQTRGSQAAFDRAAAQFGRERAADLQEQRLGLQAFQQGELGRQQQERLAQQASVAGEQARQQAARLGLTAQQAEDRARQAQEQFAQRAFDISSQLGLRTAQGLSGLGDTIQRDALARIGALSDIGGQQRALRQASLDLGYEDFLRQQGETQRQLGVLSNILRGVPVQPQRTVSTFQQQPGLFQQAVGLGLQGLGLYKGLS